MRKNTASEVMELFTKKREKAEETSKARLFELHSIIPETFDIDEQLEANVKRRDVSGFEWYLTHNFYTYDSVEKILKDIYTEKPGVLFFSVYIWNIEYVKAISKEFHKLCPTVPIWAGGPEVSYETEDFLAKNPQFSGVMIGEGEESFREVCEYYQEGGCLDYVSGIAFRRLDKVVFTPIREPIDLSSTSFAYENIEDFKNKIIYYETSRGCPFSCSYCLSSVDKKLRFKNIEKVKEELKYFLEAKVPQVKFVDRTFNCNHEHALEIWKFIRENDNGVTNFHFEISADLINESELEVLKSMRPGLVQLEIGVQTTNQDTLNEIHRHMDLKRLKAVVNAIHSFGNIHQHLDLIAGLPYEDISSFINSFNESVFIKVSSNVGTT